MNKAHDDYKGLPTPQGVLLKDCPVCGAKAELWQYSESETAPTNKLICCSSGDPFGPQEAEGVILAGCLLYMPPQAFYRATVREAVKYWNEYATALEEERLRRALAKNAF